MPQPGDSSRVVLALIWLVVGAVMVGVPAWLGLTRLDTLLNGHPAGLAGTGGCLLLGLVAVAWSVATLIAGSRFDAQGDPDRPRPRTRAQRSRRAAFRLVLAVPTLLVALVLVGWTAYARPFPASAAALAALRDDAQVSVVERPTWYELVPARVDANDNAIRATTGLVFVPGAKVDPRAYAAVLRPVAAAGYLVIVLKEPFNIALPFSDRPGFVMGVHPDVRYWAVGGHSLGGVNAAAYAEQDLQVTGLLLYASYPASPISRGSLRVTSISGAEDGLATPEDIEAAKPNLPATTTYQVVPGAVHAYFGDYGEQPGDGTPGVDRGTAQAAIAKGTIALLASLTPRRSR